MNEPAREYAQFVHFAFGLALAFADLSPGGAALLPQDGISLKIARQRVALLKKPLHLSLTQQQRMEGLYATLSAGERSIAAEVAPKYVKRAEIGRLAALTDAKVRNLLSPDQFLALKRWERTRRLTQAPPPRHR
jgi:hypothetical protein